MPDEPPASDLGSSSQNEKTEDSTQSMSSEMSSDSSSGSASEDSDEEREKKLKMLQEQVILKGNFKLYIYIYNTANYYTLLVF